MTEEKKTDQLTTLNRIGIKRVGAAAKLAEAAKLQPQEVDITKMPNRLVLVFDDSGSMSGKPIKDAKQATELFLKNCNPNDTAVAFYPLNTKKRPLGNNFALIAMAANDISDSDLGGTPLYETLESAIKDENMTRVVVFSDGEPNRSNPGIIDSYIEKKIPIDTIFIGREQSNGYYVMKDIADRTGGIFIHFKDSNSLKGGLKYLAPAFRGMLMNEELRKKVERGEAI